MTADDDNLIDNNPEANKSSEPYPGFGKRHDIFYQYQPPEPETITPSQPPVDEQTTYPPMAEDDIYADQAPGGRKKYLVTAAVFLTILTGVGLFLLFHQSPKKTANQPSSSSSRYQDPDMVSTLCYSFKLPLPHGTIVPENSCSGTYLTGNNNVIVNPIFFSSDLNGMVADWKKNNASLSIYSETAFQLNRRNADAIIYKPTDSSASSSAATISVLVFTGISGNGDSYTIQGAAISGFEIKGNYTSDDTSKQAFDEILASWNWK